MDRPGQQCDLPTVATAPKSYARVRSCGKYWKTSTLTCVSRLVFISHALEDSASAERLERVLRGWGIRVWRNIVDLPPGEQWDVMARQIIADNASAFIACFSRKSVNLDRSIQWEELRLAIEELHMRRNDSRFLIPVRFDDCVIPNISIGSGRTLRSLQKVDLFGDHYDESAERLAGAIQELENRASSSDSENARQAAGSTGGNGSSGSPIVAVFFLALIIVGFFIWRAESSSTRGPSLTASVTLPNPGAVAARMAFSPDGRMLAIGDSENDRTYLWNLAAHRTVTTLTNPRGRKAFSVAFNPGGTVLAVSDTNGSIYLWNTATHKLTAKLPGPSDLAVDSVAFSPHGTILAAGESDGRIYLWDTATRKIITKLSTRGALGVNSVAFNPDGTVLAAGDGNSDIYLWNMADHKLTATLPEPQGHLVASAVFSPTGTVLATSGGGDRVYLWNLASRKVTATLTVPVHTRSPYVYTVFRPTGTSLATGSNSAKIYLWSTVTHKTVATLTNPRSEKVVSTVAFSADGSSIAVGDGRHIYLWRY